MNPAQLKARFVEAGFGDGNGPGPLTLTFRGKPSLDPTSPEALNALKSVVAEPVSDGLIYGALKLMGVLAEEVEEESRRKPRKPVAEGTDKPRLVTLAELKEEPVEWLWEPYIAFGELTLLEGDPGRGKSTLASYIAAQVSVGGRLPAAKGQSGNVELSPVLWLTAEERLSGAVRARINVAGGNLRNVHSADTVLKLPSQLPALADFIESCGARLVVLDPIKCFLDSQINEHKDGEVRSALTPLVQVLRSHRCALLGIRHFKKGFDSSAIQRGGGSIGFAGAARSVLGVSLHPEGEEGSVLCQSKNNLAASGPSRHFTIEDCSGTGQLKWGDTLNYTAPELYATEGQRTQDKRKQAGEFLLAFLANGPQPATEVYRVAKAAGFAKRTLDRAKPIAGVESVRDGEARIWQVTQ